MSSITNSSLTLAQRAKKATARLHQTVRQAKTIISESSQSIKEIFSSSEQQTNATLAKLSVNLSNLKSKQHTSVVNTIGRMQKQSVGPGPRSKYSF